MKKFVSILLALTMILAMSIPAFATENNTLTINESNGRTYNGYQLLTLTTGLKCEETHDHDDDCYNYAYTVNEKYEEILQNLAGEGNDIIEFLASKTSDDNGTYGTLRGVADAIYRAIQAAGLAADKTGLTGTGTIEQGYWLFADVTNLSGNDAANSLVILDTRGQDALTLNPKVGLPTLVKKVKDTNDSTGVTTGWQDSADHDINDIVNFQITVTMPENLAGYKEYKVIIHDTMSAGLTLDPDSIKVSVEGSNVDVTNSFTRPGGTDGQFTLTCDNVLGIAGVKVNKDTKFVVTYDATLNEHAVIGSVGNPNTAYLEYSNNPYGTGTGKTIDDTVIVFTYRLIVNKVDEQNNALQGAGFTLHKKGTDGKFAAIGEELVGGTMTEFQWKGLDDGVYKLEETTVPAGYNKMADIEFTITAEHEEKSADPKLTSLGSTFGDVEVKDGAFTGNIEDKIKNETGTVLPETGAKGTVMLIACSSMFVMVAAVFMITRKKMSIYED